MAETSEPGKLLGTKDGRLRFDAPTELMPGLCLRAFDETLGESVSASVVSVEEEGLATTVLGTVHPHLFQPVAIVTEPPYLLLVSRRCWGTSLRERLAKIGRKHPVDAVRSVLRVADGLRHLHGCGLGHGHIRPDFVFVERTDGPSPSLVFGPRTPRLFLPPEQVPSAPVTVESDTWTLASLLYLMLVGAPPPPDGIQPEEENDLGEIPEGVLRDSIALGLSRAKEDRITDVDGLLRDLARWFVVHAGEEPLGTGSGLHRTPPPPLPHHDSASFIPTRQDQGEMSPPDAPPTPPDAPPTPPDAPPTPPASHRDGAAPRPGPWLRWTPLVGVALVGTLGIFWARSHTAQLPSPRGSAAVNLPEISVSANASIAPTDCIAGYLRRGRLREGKNLDWLCQSTNVAKTLNQLGDSLLDEDDGSAHSPGALWSSWHGVALAAGLKSACCASSADLDLGTLPSFCPTLVPSLAQISSTIVASKNLTPVLPAFQEALGCVARTVSDPDAGGGPDPETALDASVLAWRSLTSDPRGGLILQNALTSSVPSENRP